ncbi:hypothetical protein SETIT_6G191300v2 [Setaria italica]|uniref:Uncharacterized protein n=1 Tax=Setaria italica TaxID=4555 RepID=K3YLI2_SETIT|nr:hypothetical protein SETIT_6G191300v2 [Setaria italica]
MLQTRSRLRLKDASLHPPSLPTTTAPPGSPGCSSTGKLAYVADLRNATTASSETWEGHEIQVTLRLARPPAARLLPVRLLPRAGGSTSCSPWSRGSSPRRTTRPPPHHRHLEKRHPEGRRLLRLPGRRRGSRRGERLPRPPSPYGFDPYSVRILRSGRTSDTTAGGFYFVAGLGRAPNAYAMDPGEFVLCLHNSNFPTSWRSIGASMAAASTMSTARSSRSEVTPAPWASSTSGGASSSATCSRLSKANPPLRYVTLPPPLLPAEDSGDVRNLLGTSPSSNVVAPLSMSRCSLDGSLAQPAGVATSRMAVSRTWSTVAADCSKGCRDPGCRQESSGIPVDGNPHFELLSKCPKLLDHGGEPLESSFKGLDICQPTLSLDDDDDDDDDIV